MLQNKDSVCLEDVCEVFRCDVISGAMTPDYWDIALCIEDDMNRIYRKCTVRHVFGENSKKSVFKIWLNGHT